MGFDPLSGPNEKWYDIGIAHGHFQSVCGHGCGTFARRYDPMRVVFVCRGAYGTHGPPIQCHRRWICDA